MTRTAKKIHRCIAWGLTIGAFPVSWLLLQPVVASAMLIGGVIYIDFIELYDFCFQEKAQ